jgi:hypothetical protein
MCKGTDFWDCVQDDTADTLTDVVKNWMRQKNTLEYLGLWEKLNNPNFKGVEFDPLLAEAGSNAFTMSPTRYTKGPYCFSGSELKEQMCNRANIGSWKYYNKLLEQAVNERIIVKSYDKVGHVIYTPAPF